MSPGTAWCSRRQQVCNQTAVKVETAKICNQELLTCVVILEKYDKL